MAPEPRDTATQIALRGYLQRLLDYGNMILAFAIFQEVL